MQTSRRSFSWSELPPDLLLAIAERLKVRDDVLRFRAVCKSWYRSTIFSLTLTPPEHILSPILPLVYYGFIPGFQSKCHIALVASYVHMLRSVVNPNLPPWLFTVEEFNQGKLFLRQPFSQISLENKLPSNFPKDLDVSKFRVTEICKHYTLRFAHDGNELFAGKYKQYHNCSKVLLCVDPNCKNIIPTFDDYSAIVLFDNGLLAELRLRDGYMSVIERYGAKIFDDVLNFKGMVCAIDRQGRLFCKGKNGWLMSVCELLELGQHNKRRLVESCGAELYLVCRYSAETGVAFVVYKLNEDHKKWDRINGIGDDRILFATSDGCFFIPTKDVPRWKGNCIVFPRRCFPDRRGFLMSDYETFKVSKPTELGIAVFHFDSGKVGPIEDFLGYPLLFWPPPPWLSLDLDTRLSKQVFEEVEADRMSSTVGCQVDTQTQAHYSSTTIEENPSIEEDLGRAKQVQGNNTIASDSAISTTPKSTERSVSKAKFRGVDVSSDLIPTLRKIWTKYGNILEGHAAKSEVHVARAVESLAKVVILLQCSSSKTLNDAQARYMSSTIVELQAMQLNVSWLVPYVEKASRFHSEPAVKAKLKGALSKIKMMTSQVEDLKKKLLAEIDGFEQMLSEQKETVVTNLRSVEKLVDEDIYLGEGLC